MSPNRARLLVGVAAALVLVLLVVGFMAGEREQHRLDRDRQAESTLEASLRVTRASTASQRRNIKAAAVFGKALAHDLVDANADVTLTQAVLTNAKDALQQAQNALGSQSARRATVEQCLTGVRRGARCDPHQEHGGGHVLPPRGRAGLPERARCREPARRPWRTTSPIPSSCAPGAPTTHSRRMPPVARCRKRAGLTSTTWS